MTKLAVTSHYCILPRQWGLQYWLLRHVSLWPYLCCHIWCSRMRRQLVKVVCDFILGLRILSVAIDRGRILFDEILLTLFHRSYRLHQVSSHYSSGTRIGSTYTCHCIELLQLYAFWLVVLPSRSLSKYCLLMMNFPNLFRYFLELSYNTYLQVSPLFVVMENCKGLMMTRSGVGVFIFLTFELSIAKGTGVG